MSDLSAYSEQKLLKELTANNEDAFHSLFETHWDKVYSAALVITKSTPLAEDVAQEVFLRLWQNRHTATEIQNLSGFLFITTRNLVYNKLKRLKLEDAYSNYLRLELPPYVENGTKADYNELQKLIQTGISRLPPQQQRAFRLSREDGMTHEQIAAEMNISRDSVKDYIVRALAYLRKFMQGYISLVFSVLLNLLNF